MRHVYYVRDAQSTVLALVSDVKHHLQAQHFNTMDTADECIDLFLTQCKKVYLLGIRPASYAYKSNDEIAALISIFCKFKEIGQIEIFYGFLQEGHYFIDLWAAHLIVGYGNPPSRIFSICISIIKDQSENSMYPDVAEQEKKWLMDRGYD